MACVSSELLAQAPDDAVDLAGEAVDDPRADRVDGGLADQRAWRVEVDARQLRRARRERLDRDLDARRDDPAEVLAVGRDRVVGDRRAEVHDDARAAEALVRGDRVDQAVGAELARVLDPDRHAGLHAGAHHEHLVAEVVLGHVRPRRAQRRDHGGHDRRRDLVEAEAAQAEQVLQRGAELVGGRLAHGREAPVLDELVAAVGARGGSACCRRRRRAACGRLSTTWAIRAATAGPRGAPPARLPRRARRGRRRAASRPGAPGPGSSSSSGTSTKRRLARSSCGSRRRSEAWTRSPSRSTSTSISRGPWRSRARRPSSASTALQASSNASGSSSVRIAGRR